MKPNEFSLSARRGIPKGAACLIAICIAVIVIPPLIVFLLYSIGKSCPVVVVPWTAGETLGYCGAVDAAVVALLGLFLSIRDGWEQQRAQLRESVAPYFLMVILKAMNKKNPFSPSVSAKGSETKACCGDDLPSGYCEVDVCEVYAIVGDDIVYRSRLTDNQRERVESTLLTEEIAEGAFAIVSNPVISIPLRFRNVGQGCANGVRVGVNRKEDEWKGVCSWSLDHGEDFYLLIYIDTDHNVLGDYEVRIVFNDCLGYRYMEAFSLIVERDASGRENASTDYVGRKTVID